MFISEKRLAGQLEDGSIITPGSRTICHAMATITKGGSDNTDQRNEQVKVKLDSCGSVSIAHTDHLTRVKSAKSYGLNNIRLLGIGGKTNYLTKVGMLPVVKGDDGVCFLLCYTFDAPLGDTEKVVLLGLHTMMKANINILQHMKDSIEGNCSQLSFWPQGKTFDEALKELSCDDNIRRVFKITSQGSPRDIYISTSEYEEVTGKDLVNLAVNHVETGSTILEEAYMTEIQLKRIVDRTNQEQGNQLSDGDEIMIMRGLLS